MDNKSLFAMSKLLAIAMILGALLTLPIEYLFLQTHGPYEQALNQIVWGLNDHDYSRWAMFPLLLILPGLRAFYLRQRDQIGKAGLWGCRLTFAGSLLIAGGQIWSYVLFDPFEHPMHVIGWLAQYSGLLLLAFIGLPLWAVANLRAGTLSGWQIAIPTLWVLYVIGLCIHIFTSDEMWLYSRFGIDTGFIASALLSSAYVLMGIILWTKGEYA